MPTNLRYPNIKGTNPIERTEEIRKYLYYLVDTLNFTETQTNGNKEQVTNNADEYIVGQRKENGFYVRKWSSGIIEAFGTITLESMYLNAAGNYYSANIFSQRIKCGMRKVYDLQTSAACNTDTDIFVTQAKFENEEFKCRICSNTQNIENVQIRIHIIGRK